MNTIAAQSTLNNRYLRKTTPEEQLLYDHLLYCVQVESTSELIERFRFLFIEGSGYKEPKISAALSQIATSKQASRDYPSIINRCCHILVNRWQMNPQTQPAIIDLVKLFENLPTPGGAGRVTARGTRQIRLLTREFTKTEQYLTLQRLARITESQQNKERKLLENSQEDTVLVANLISRYPFLHEHCLLNEDSGYEHQHTIRKLQTQLQRQFELDLSQYVTYQVRRAQLSRSNPHLTRSPQIIQPVCNPTLLSDRELGNALKQFVGKVYNGRTYNDLAQSFITHTSHVPSFQTYKDDLYEYLVTSMDSKYGRVQFNERLYRQLKNTLPHYDTKKPSEFLLLRTASQLLNFLVVESRQCPNHYIFVDMITNIGPTGTVGLLLKVVLICRKVKPYLEKRFSILFNHYESSAKNGVPWLVKSLDNLHIAFSVHFGSVDLSYLKQIM